MVMGTTKTTTIGAISGHFPSAKERALAEQLAAQSAGAEAARLTDEAERQIALADAAGACHFCGAAFWADGSGAANGACANCDYAERNNYRWRPGKSGKPGKWVDPK